MFASLAEDQGSVSRPVSAGSEPAVTPAPADLMSFAGFQGHAHIYPHRDAHTHSHNKTSIFGRGYADFRAREITQWFRVLAAQT